MTNKAKNVGCVVVGYGAYMGKYHCEWIRNTEGLSLLAVCDVNPDRTEAAKKDFPRVKTYNDLDEMLKEQDIDLVTIVTPHNTHAQLALQCLRAGRNVIVEKPMCVTTAEATAMIEEAKKRNLMLSVFHQRRYDGDFLAMKEAIDKGLIGNVFHLEVFAGGYNHPGYVWRSDKKTSGGAIYDNGAHFIDQILNLVPERVVGVAGFFHKLVWKDVTNEDQVEAVIRFESGAIADLQISSVACIDKARWRILGTKGGILDERGEQYFKAITMIEGIPAEMKIKYKDRDWPAYYRNIADHLLRGAELKVKPEEARRVIAVMEAAEKSSRRGRIEKVPV